ncbi:DUF1622 domain-containing protein [Hyalangium sp.]|uniref:DUF1622 domain-containing protein n=1 Tax=Hyalangium sp. TaxID=2028555 RepID=UPI002D2605AD|nr:DUF1622 domain-containing protein [Hyalangium sp.]HYH96717.1 DUF1622 domain-containing protein [Hyalangium sp.]
MTFGEWIALGGQLMEGVGVSVMILGAVLSVVLLGVRRRRRVAGLYRKFRQDLGRAILLGLEFLVAADIIRTVSEEPTLRGVAVLGIIVVIRTFLSFTLSVELEGRWPWQRGLEHEEPRKPAALPSKVFTAPQSEHHADH